MSLVMFLSNKATAKKEAGMSKNSFAVRPNSLSLIVGIAGFMFCLLIIVMMYAFPNDTDSTWVAVGFGVGSFLGLWLIINYFIFRVIFTSDKVIIFNWFKKSEYKLADLTSAKLIGCDESVAYELKLYIDDKRIISFDSQCIGFNFAVKRIEELGISISKQDHNTFKELFS